MAHGVQYLGGHGYSRRGGLQPVLLALLVAAEEVPEAQEVLLVGLHEVQAVHDGQLPVQRRLAVAPEERLVQVLVEGGDGVGRLPVLVAVAERVFLRRVAGRVRRGRGEDEADRGGAPALLHAAHGGEKGGHLAGVGEERPQRQRPQRPRPQLQRDGQALAGLRRGALQGVQVPRHTRVPVELG